MLNDNIVLKCFILGFLVINIPNGAFHILTCHCELLFDSVWNRLYKTGQQIGAN
jgi:hypothetical protein